MYYGRMTNYHTHTHRCKHASGTASDYAKAAVEKGFTEFGFSDHSPLPDNRWLNVRMHLDELEDYVREMDVAVSTYPDLSILKGAECEYAPEYVSFYKEELMGRLQFDYLAGGAHYFPVGSEWIFCYGADESKKNLFAYTDYIINSMKSGLFSFIAHPDLFARFYLTWDQETEACTRAIAEAAVATQSLLEINGYGYRKKKIETPEGPRRPYPLDPFWKIIAEYDLSVIINSDAHTPDDLDHFGDAVSLAESLSLKVVETLPRK